MNRLSPVPKGSRRRSGTACFVGIRAGGRLAGARHPDRAGDTAHRLADAGRPGAERPLVVRSSSLYEDSERSSMAGHFESVLDVGGWDDYDSAIRAVLASARRIRPPRPSAPQRLPGDGMAVLVQPMLTSAVGGVMFGSDAVEGRTDRILVSAVRGGSDQFVGGGTQGVHSCPPHSPVGRRCRRRIPSPRCRAGRTSCRRVWDRGRASGGCGRCRRGCSRGWRTGSPASTGSCPCPGWHSCAGTKRCARHRTGDCLGVYAVKSAAWSRAHWVKARAGVPVRSSTVPVISGGTPTV